MPRKFKNKGRLDVSLPLTFDEEGHVDDSALARSIEKGILQAMGDKLISYILEKYPNFDINLLNQLISFLVSNISIQGEINNLRFVMSKQSQIRYYDLTVEIMSEIDRKPNGNQKDNHYVVFSEILNDVNRMFRLRASRIDIDEINSGDYDYDES